MENARELFQIMTRRFGLLNKNCCSVGGCDISLAQSHLLYEIDRRHKPSMQQVAEALGTEITTFSRQVQSLIQMKLVKKTPDPNDRRVYTLSLTAEGKMIAGIIDQQMNDYLDEVFSYMTEFEKETVLRSVKLFNEAMGKSSRCCAPVTG
ncbi:winged helix-turn-helix transcriptional regulator [Paenibacillus sp. 7124]|uniref:Winged helix-turn-helix transcriptional regulator n=2 Tax=Paenibacillus TaxID=44249 RepID=A0A6M1PQV3_9BACL|nr:MULTISPECIES: MarR family winged helix-turn-helix transcriptional regulator [Paenibacillus]AHV97394.1 multidrug resistance operon repressor [Paenibacillus sabinae T27]NGM84123.1 winged helix-turn-helix transcriptional regulator [Paenibacillus apii]NJJ38696.1 winged helix-turn-helix transcriptional regulator [Paenibacillus apii]